MAKLQLQLNGNKGLAPNHYGNSLYLASRPELKYVGSQGQKAEGVYWSERYNGYMSPLPNAYQDVLVIEQDLTNVSDSAIQMAFTDRKDTETSIVFADGDGLYTAQKNPTISGIVDAFDFNDGYSTPVFERFYGKSFTSEQSIEGERFNAELIYISDEYAISAYQSGPNSNIGSVDLYKITDGKIELADTLQHESVFYNWQSFAKISDTRFLLAYQGENSDGFVKVFNVNYSDDTISESTNFEFERIRADFISTSYYDGRVHISYRNNNDESVLKVYDLVGNTFTLGFEQVYRANGLQNYVNAEGGRILTSASGGGGAGDATLYNFQERFYREVIQETSFTHSQQSQVSGASMARVDDSNFIVALRGVADDGYICSYTVLSSGEISFITSNEHDTVGAFYNELIVLNDNYCVLAYTADNASGPGVIKTFDYNDSLSQKSSFVHANLQVRDNTIEKIDDNHFLLAYQGPGGDGFIKTFNVDENGDITQLDVLEHDTSNYSNGSLVRLLNGNFALTYANSGNIIMSEFSVNSSFQITKVSSTTIATGSRQPFDTVIDENNGWIIVPFRNASNQRFGVLVVQHNFSTSVFSILSETATPYAIGTGRSSIALYSTPLFDDVGVAINHFDASNGDLHMYTAIIDVNGNIVLTGEDLEYNLSANANSSIDLINLNGTHFISHSYASVESFRINRLIELTDSYLFDSNVATQQKILYDSSSGNYLLYYHTTQGGYKIKTINVDFDGIISETNSIDLNAGSLSFNGGSFVLRNGKVFVFGKTTDSSFVHIYDYSSGVLSNQRDIQLPSEISFSPVLHIGTNNNLFALYKPKSQGGTTVYSISNYEDFLNRDLNILDASRIIDVTRSQFAGAISYYYTWGDQIGRASSLANIGKEIDSKDTVNWIFRSNNSQSLQALRAANPHFVNSKNQYVYILDSESVHGINIAISGTVEDVDGTFDSDLIVFQSGVSLIDGVDYNENIYFSMVEGDTDVDLWNLPADTSTKTNCYVYVWNKISGQQLQANKIELLDCKHVGRGFSMGGMLYFLTINSANVSEIRILNRGSFQVLHEIGPDNEFNIGKQSVTVTEMGAILATNKGNLFLLDKGNELKKLGTFATDIDKTSPALVIYGGGEGHEPSNTSQGLHPVVPHLTITYRNTSNENKIKKFYLRNVGTMLNQYKGFTPTTEQQAWLDLNVPELPLVANQGNVYSLVEFLPKLSTLKECVIYCKPTGIITDGEITEIAKIHLYKNQETTPFFTHSVTDKNASRGYLEFNLDTKYVNAVQLEVEYNTTLPIGENDFTPLTGVLEYAPTNTKK